LFSHNIQFEEAAARYFFIMDIKPDSLIEQPEQLQLIPSSEIPDKYFEAEELPGGIDRPNYTGQRLYANDPERYHFIVSLLAEGIGILRISRIVSCHPYTVSGVRDREGGAIEIEKERISGEARMVARLCVEGIMECLTDPDRLKKVSVKDLAIIHGIMVEKSEVLGGRPGQIIGTQDQTAGHSELVAYMNQLREAHETRLEREETEQKGNLGAEGCVNAIDVTGTVRVEDAHTEASSTVEDDSTSDTGSLVDGGTTAEPSTPRTLAADSTGSLESEEATE